MNDLASKLAAAPPPPVAAKVRAKAPTGFSYEWDGVAGHIETGPLPARPRTWDAFVRDAGLDPAEVEVEEPVQVRGWDAPAGGGNTVRMRYYRLTVKRYRAKANLDELVRAARSRRKPKTPAAVEQAETADSAYLIALGDLQLGKALADETPTLTTEGWKAHGDIRPGDHVYGPDGTPKKVLAVTGSTMQQGYNVVFDRGVVITATADHIWQGVRRFHPTNYRKNGGPTWEYRDVQMTTQELLDQPRFPGKKTANRALMVDLTAPVQMPEQDLPVDPYTLGLWLGDGNSHTGTITLNAEDAHLIDGLGPRIPSNEVRNMASVRVTGLTKHLRSLDLITNKHIPPIYAGASAEQRLALLQGLMDTDGHCTAKGWAEITTVRESLAADIRSLITSLGFKVTTREGRSKLNGKDYGPKWSIHFTTRPDVPVFRLERKLERAHTGAQTWTRYRQVQYVEPVGMVSAQCLTVEGSLYLAGRDLVTTHNCDGDGVEGTVNRFLSSTKAAIDRYKMLGRPGPIYLAHLGDCIEGFVSQKGDNAWRTSLTLTEQVRLYRRLLLEQVKELAAVTDRLVVVGVGGNHDQGNRPIHTYDDSWGVEAIAQVRDAIQLAGAPYDHVTMFAPERDEMTLTLDMAGTKVGLAHGHQFRPGQAINWWAKQSHGRQPIGDADMLITGHLHHLRIEASGAKTWIQAPALESESTWFRHAHGEVARPGIITAVVGGGSWRSLEVLI